MEAAFLRIGQSTIRSELTNATGARGIGTYRLALNLEWSPTSFDELEGAKILLGGELQVSFAQDAPLPLAQLQAIYAMAFPTRAHGTSARIDLGVNLSAAQVEALERERDGGPIKLHLNLQGGVFRGASDATTPLSLGFWDNLVYRFRPSDWLEILEHWRYAQGFLIQVPMIDGPDSGRIKSARADLERAIEHMSEGRSREAVAACRDALEVAFGDDSRQYPELGYKAPGIEDAGKDARFWLVQRGLRAVAHAAKHRDGATADIEWERRDARALVVMVSALLEREPA
jgi:hypothetical protein